LSRLIKVQLALNYADVIQLFIYLFIYFHPIFNMIKRVLYDEKSYWKLDIMWFSLGHQKCCFVASLIEHIGSPICVQCVVIECGVLNKV